MLVTRTVLLRSGMKGNFHVPFCRAVEKVTSSLTLIIKVAGGHTAKGRITETLNGRGGNVRPVSKQAVPRVGVAARRVASTTFEATQLKLF